MGTGNMGDAAIQESFIENIHKRLPGARLIAFSLHPADTRKRHGIEAHPINWCYPGWQGESRESNSASVEVKPESLKSRLTAFIKRFKFLYSWMKPVHDSLQETQLLFRSYKIVRSLDLLVMSGGGQLCELYGPLPYNVFKFCVLARLSNTPVYIVGVGADLLKKPSNKFYARWAVRLANFTSFRSVESQAMIRELGVRKKTHVVPDPAYGLDVPEYLNSSRAETITTAEAEALLHSAGCEMDLLEHVPDGGPVPPGMKVGLNPIGYCDPRRWPRKDDPVYRAYIDKLAFLSVWLRERNFNLELFSSDIGGDLFAIDDLRKKLRAGAYGAAPFDPVVRTLPTLKELLVQMSTFDYVVTSRFHGVIFSHMLAKPVIALSYLPKIDDLIRTVGHERYCLEIESFEAKSLVETFQSMADEKEQLESLFREKSGGYARILQQHFDDVFLTDPRRLPGGLRQKTVVETSAR
jgi:polysaccharide pyruvyl transferase WcaK-like protein